MQHQFVGRPIGKVEGGSSSINGLDISLGPGLLYDSRVVKIADAIRAGEIEGEIYSDGEVWVNAQALTAFLARHIPA